MNKTTYQRHYENVEKGIFKSDCRYQIPKLEAERYLPCQFLPFNYAKSCTGRETLGVHFFIDDYQFLRLWNRIDTYIPMLQQFKCVMTPDFSLYDDFPEALQIYNHYRKHWLGVYMQNAGIHVIPTVAWSNEASLAWCFEGEPTHGTVAVSSVGANQTKAARQNFLAGYRKMVERLEPETIIFYGPVPDDCWGLGGEIKQIRAYQEKFKELE